MLTSVTKKLTNTLVKQSEANKNVLKNRLKKGKKIGTIKL